MRHSVLDDQGLDPLRVGQGHPETHGAAVILHIKRVVRDAQRFGEVVHDLGVVIERVGELLRVRPVAVAKARVVGRDEVIAIGKPGEERLEHPRGRRKSVQQQKRWRVLRPGLPVKDRETVDLFRAIDSLVIHGMFPSLGSSPRLQRYEHHATHRRQKGYLSAPGAKGSTGATHAWVLLRLSLLP